MDIKRWNGQVIGKKELINMAVMTKPMLSNFAIKSSKAEEFIRESNKNVISKDFLNKCMEASKLFNRK